MARQKLNPQVAQRFKTWQIKRKALRKRINKELEGKNRRTALAELAKIHHEILETENNWKKGKTPDGRAMESLNRVIAGVDNAMRQSWEE